MTPEGRRPATDGLDRIRQDNARAEAANRLRTMEFRQLAGELEQIAAAPTNPAQKAIDAGDGATWQLPYPDPEVIDLLGLPRLNVPIGRIATHRDEHSLPVVGLFVAARDHQQNALALIRLLSAHHRDPFSRPLFICENLDLVPLLGRYGFAYHLAGPDIFDLAGAWLNRRFGMVKVRDLLTGAVIWELTASPNGGASSTTG